MLIFMVLDQCIYTFVYSRLHSCVQLIIAVMQLILWCEDVLTWCLSCAGSVWVLRKENPHGAMWYVCGIILLIWDLPCPLTLFGVTFVLCSHVTFSALCMSSHASFTPSGLTHQQTFKLTYYVTISAWTGGLDMSQSIYSPKTLTSYSGWTGHLTGWPLHSSRQKETSTGQALC